MSDPLKLAEEMRHYVRTGMGIERAQARAISKAFDQVLAENAELLGQNAELKRRYNTWPSVEKLEAEITRLRANWERLKVRLTCNAEANHSALGDYGRGWGDGFKAVLEEVNRIERGE